MPLTARRAHLVLLLLAALSLASLLASATTGSVALNGSELWQGLSALISGQNSTLAATLLELRLQRALVAWVTGASLALAGVMMQALLRNPLADPYVLGVSGGASAGALLAMLLGASIWLVDMSAVAGAVAISLLLLLLARDELRSGGGSPLLLLTGVILASGCGALVTLMLSIAPDSSLRGMVFWLIGDLSGSELRLLPWLVLAIALAFSLQAARGMNLLALHGEMASTFGIRVSRLRYGLFGFAALLTASAVTGAGSIGFLGLIVPHACRFALGPDHRLLLPAAAISGGLLLVLADTLSRTLIAPQQLPVGVITALIGVPAFLLQLRQVRRSGTC
ncbi:iron ABC transporter permease [Craterilacuibacter sp. RT1T]|uniref:FecCD family ABC transporter permease n=1 Tax=Craterilacuibacter sp. RT1T TaxID=2942211 RepID=UPI0020BDE0EB|nr:iron ABC transporter permease [Craterilacuibacter sp. RT1T]MCL6264185.1 iron ABC transporter permease [Craterilacuibacter sp. RT1T]